MYGDQNKWASFQGADGFAVGDTNVSARPPEEALANADYIVKCANAHEELMDTCIGFKLLLTELLEAHPDEIVYQKALMKLAQTVARAEGE